jgi:hypothetical protein
MSLTNALSLFAALPGTGVAFGRLSRPLSRMRVGTEHPVIGLIGRYTVQMDSL